MGMSKYTAPTMREALEIVRTAIGENAVVLNTRTISEPAAPGCPAVECVEIWVQTPEVAPDSVVHSTLTLTPPVTTQPEDASPELSDDMDPQLQALHTEVNNLHAQFDQLSQQMGWLGSGGLGASAQLLQHVALELAGKIAVSGGIQCVNSPHLVALVGPTGVGKTTMLGRLAWHFVVHEGARVGVITLDTHRLGALEQIRLYCKHLDIPLETIYTVDDINPARERLSTCELILIDTPGGGAQTLDATNELHTLLQALDPEEVHLVLSATTGSSAFREMLKRYAPLHPDQLILTKLDETDALLELLPLLLESGLAVSYLGDNQGITQDCLLATTEKINSFFAPR